MTDGDQANNQGNQQANGAQGNSGDNGGNAGAGKTFSQEQMDAIIADRLTRERGKYKDYDELKASKGELDKLKQSQMGDLEKAQAQLKAIQDENTSLKGRVQSAAAESAATRAGAMYPDLVAAKIPADVMDDPKKLEAAINEIKKQYPALFGKQSGSADGGAGGKPAAGANDWIRNAAGVR